MEIFVIWLSLSIVAAVIASKKGRSGFGFFLLAVVLSPLIGIIGALIASENREAVEAAKIAAGENKKCPYCAEIIRKEAKVCRFCGRDLVEPEKPAPAEVKIPATSRLIPVELYAKEKNIDEAEAIRAIKDGKLKGRLVGIRWAVERSEL